MGDAGRARNVVAGVAGVALAVALLTWCFSRAEMDKFWAALGSLTVLAVLPALACELAVQMAKALKWMGVLRGVAEVRYRNALSAVVIGAAATHVVPLRLDELLRAGVLGRREGIDSAKVLGTVGIDRVIEVFVAGALLGIIALSGELHGWMHRGAQLLWGGFVVGVVALVVFVRAEEGLRARLAASSVPGVAAAAGILASLAEGLRSLPRGRALLIVALGSAGEWLATIAFYVWTLDVFGVDAPLSVALVMALGNAVAYAVPNVPGALGTYEKVQVSILVAAIAGMTEGEALALALAAHAVLMIPVTLAGGIVALIEWRRGGPLPVAAAEAAS